MSPREREGRAATPLPIRVSVIGRCDIMLGRSRVRPESAVLFALLLYLTLRAGSRVTRDELLDLLWPGSLERSRRHALRQLLYRVRRAGLPLDVDGAEMTIDPSAVSTDIGRLFAPDWASKAEVADIPSPRAILPTYRPSLGAAFDAWIEGVRDDAATQIRRACLRHIAVGRREGRWEDVESVARICLACDPLNEDATLGLAEATAMAGAQAESLRILDAYLWEIGGQTGTVGHEAKLLRRRIASQPQFHLVRSGEPPLIGRSQDLAWLNERRDAVGAETPATAMLVGPPGIGKTTVARAFTGYAEMRGWQVAVARLQPTDGDRPMSVFLELLPRLLKAAGALGASPESIAQLRRLLGLHNDEDDILAGLSQEAEAVQARIRASALDLLGAVAHEAPVILLLEDLHWIDAPSLRLLAWLVEHADKLPVLWLLTSRMESRFPMLREVFPGDRVPAHTVGPLDAAESAELFTAFAPSARRDPRVAEMAFAATGGNPLFIREAAGHWTDTGEQKLSANLRSLMTERVARLAPASRRVLHCCAVLGRFATVPRVSAVLEVATVELLEAIEELDGLGLVGISGEPGSLALHDLWQEQLMSTMRASGRALLHLRSGEVLETESRGHRSAAIVVDAARHLMIAGATARAIQLLCEAAEHQLANGLTEDAVAGITLAISATTDPRECLRLAMWRLQMLQTLGNWMEAISSLEHITIISSDAGIPLEPHSDLELTSLEATLTGEYRLQEVINRARICLLAPWAAEPHRAKAARLGARASSNLLASDDLTYFAKSARLLNNADAEARPSILAVEMIFHTELGSLDLANDLASEFVRLERSQGTPRGLLQALRNSTVPLRAAGRLNEAYSTGTNAFETAARQHLAADAAAAADIVANILLESGDPTEAKRWLARAEPWVKRIGSAYARSESNITGAMIALEFGDADQARTLCSDVLNQIEIEPAVRRRMFYYSVAVRAAILCGERTIVDQHVEQLEALLRQSRGFSRLDYFYASCVRAYQWLDMPSFARTTLKDVKDSYGRSGAPLSRELSALQEQVV